MSILTRLMISIMISFINISVKYLKCALTFTALHHYSKAGSQYISMHFAELRLKLIRHYFDISNTYNDY